MAKSKSRGPKESLHDKVAEHAPSGLLAPILLPEEDMVLIEMVAIHRAAAHGGAPSVSAVLHSLVEAHRADLEAEVGPCRPVKR